MVITNGHIDYNVGESESNSLDLYGNPTKPNFSSVRVRCCIETAKYSRSARYDNEERAIECEFIVTVEMIEVPANWSPKAVNVTHDKMGALGEFTVQRIEYDELTQQVRLWV